MKRIYGIDFIGVWVDQSTRIINDRAEGDAVYRPAEVYEDGDVVPAEYVVASGPSRVLSLFWKFFDHFRTRNDPGRTLILLVEPTVIEYTMEDILSSRELRHAVAESCMACYYGWDEANLPSELSKAVNGEAKYTELF